MNKAQPDGAPKSASKSATGRVSNWVVAVFSAPGAPLLALTLPTIIFLPPYFRDQLGLGAFATAIIFIAARLLDIIIDPMLGGWQDRTISKFGRRRLWIAASCPFVIVLVWVAFIALSPGANPFIAGAIMLVLYSAYAAMMVAHLGWAGELDPTYHGRTRVLGAVQAAGLAGQIIILAAAAASQLLFHTGPAGAVHAMGWTLIAMLALTTMAAMTWVPERRLPPQPHLGLSAAVRTLMENRIVRRVLLPDLLLGIAQGVSGGLFMDYCRHALGFQREAEALLFVYFIASLAGVPFWVWLGRKFGKHVALQYAFLYAALTTVGVLLVQPGELTIAAIMIGIAGLSQGAGVLLTRSLMADVVDDDELRTGARRSGLFFGLLLTTSKIGLATGPLTYFALGFVDFDGAIGAANSALAMNTLTLLFIAVPMFLYALAALSLRKYPLDEVRQRELAAAIAARDDAKL